MLCVLLRCGCGVSVSACACVHRLVVSRLWKETSSHRTPSHEITQQEENGEVKEVQAAESFAEASSLIAAQGS